MQKVYGKTNATYPGPAGLAASGSKDEGAHGATLETLSSAAETWSSYTSLHMLKREWWTPGSTSGCFWEALSFFKMKLAQRWEKIGF